MPLLLEWQHKMPLLLEWGKELHFSCVYVVETILLLLLISEETLDILYIILIAFVVVAVMFQNRQVIVNSLDYCWYSGGSPQSLNYWSSCNVWRKMGVGGDGG